MNELKIQSFLTMLSKNLQEYEEEYDLYFGNMIVRYGSKMASFSEISFFDENPLDAFYDADCSIEEFLDDPETDVELIFICEGSIYEKLYYKAGTNEECSKLYNAFVDAASENGFYMDFGGGRLLFYS